MSQPVQVATGQPYGQAQAQAQAQAMIPLPSADNVVPLHAPTQRPDQPITAGAPVGPGPNSMPLPTPGPEAGSTDDLLERLRGAAVNFPEPGLLALILALEARR